MLEQIEDSHIEIIPVGDIFQSGMQTLVNPINCKGIMGAGLAKDFKTKYPEMFTEYKDLCKQNKVKPGKPYLSDKTHSATRVLNFPTKDDWRNKSNLRDIQAGLRYIAEHATALGISSIAMPAIGCGLGGLKWEDVLPEILAILGPLNIPIKIFKEGPNLEKKNTSKKNKRKGFSPVRATSVVPESIFTKKTRIEEENPTVNQNVISGPTTT